MPKVGVLLSGCGFLDGAEIHEAVFTLLALDRHGVEIVCCAPDTDQSDVVDHRTQESVSETRNVMAEAARIARGEIRAVSTVSADELDALIMPGGFGAAKNLCDFAAKGPDCDVNPDVEQLISAMLTQKKPIGAICIAPALLARVAGKHDISATITIGNDVQTAAAIEKAGCRHAARPVTEIAVDEANRVVSTPAYMLGPSPAPVCEGITKLVDRVLQMI